MKRLAVRLAVAASRLGSRNSYVLEEFAAGRSLDGAGRVAIFVHYDGSGRVHGFVVHHLKALRLAGFEIVFVSNAPALHVEDVQKLRGDCARILRRKNVGYDFGAYKDGLLTLGDLSRLDEVALVNDSIYGPLFDLRPLLSRCTDRAAIWGVTDSWEIQYHLQSYFLLFKKEALLSPAFRKFWNDVLYVPSKNWIIEQYEVGFTQKMLRSGLSCAALFPYQQAVATVVEAAQSDALSGGNPTAPLLQYMAWAIEAVAKGVPLNPTHYLWEFLLEAGCPFLKRNLLVENSQRVPSLDRWPEIIRKGTSYDPGLIRQHMEAMGIAAPTEHPSPAALA